MLEQVAAAKTLHTFAQVNEKLVSKQLVVLVPYLKDAVSNVVPHLSQADWSREVWLPLRHVSQKTKGLPFLIQILGTIEKILPCAQRLDSVQQTVRC